MTVQYPAGQNTFVPNAEASGKLRIDFSRNVKDFPLNRYAQIVPTPKTTGYYLSCTVEEAGRIINSDLAEFAWPDGSDAPEDNDGTESFEWKEFREERFKYGFRMGFMAADQADWDITDQHMNIKAQQAMTGRTLKAVTALLATANYDATHTSDVQSISGNTGKWNASTTARQDIKRSLNTAANLIMKDTLAVVKPGQLMLVLSPTLAMEMSQCQEIVDHIKGSPDALAQIRGDLPGKNVLFGLPDHLYGFPVEIENTVRVSSRKGATRSADYVFTDTKAAMVSRVGGLEGKYGGPSFSTLTIFVDSKRDMEVLTKRDTENEVVKGRIVDNFAAKLTAPVSGYLFTNCK